MGFQSEFSFFSSRFVRCVWFGLSRRSSSIPLPTVHFNFILSFCLLFLFLYFFFVRFYLSSFGHSSHFLCYCNLRFDFIMVKVKSENCVLDRFSCFFFCVFVPVRFSILLLCSGMDAELITDTQGYELSSW